MLLAALLMVYLSANGEVIGQFDPQELPAVLAGGKIPPETFFWREGMPDWRPLRELVLPPARRPSEPESKLKIEPARMMPAAVARAGFEPKLKLEQATVGRQVARQPFVPRGQPGVTKPDKPNPAKPAPQPSATPAQDAVVAPAAKVPGSGLLPKAEPTASVSRAGRKPFVPRVQPAVTPAPAPAAAAESPRADASPESAAASAVMRHRAPNPEPSAPVAALAAPKVVAPPQRRGRWLAMTALLLLLLGALGGAGWWFFLSEPPTFSGEVRIAGGGEELVPAKGAAVFIVPQEELAARWRRQLEEAGIRATELEALLGQAKTAHRETSLVFEQAARVSEVADEYNMPDAPELRAERDVAQSAEAAALAEVERITREKEAAMSPLAFLAAPPEAIFQTGTDEDGAFQVPWSDATEGLAVFIVSNPSAENASEARGWLAPLDMSPDRDEVLRFSPQNALDADQIREIAGAAP